MSAAKNETRISVKVQPSAPRNEIVGFTGDVLRIKIAAPPERDKANKELIDFLSQTLDISKSRITIIKGHTSHNKVIAIQGFTGEELIKKLSL